MLVTHQDPIFINGYSQLGASPNTLPDGDNAFLAIDLDGIHSGFNAGLTISAGGSTVQGLVIQRFKNEGILVISGVGNVIRGNFLGTDQTGKLDRGNGISGVALLTSFNVVGGTDPADRNLISGNDFAGVAILDAATTSNRVEGNFIGTDDTGDLPVPNAGAGVRLLNVAGNTVGGTAPGAGNIIAFNATDGIQVAANGGPANPLLGNSIDANGDLGIDLGSDGVTPNDPPASLDGDDGPNDLQNFPVLARAFVEDGATVVEGILDSAASTIYRVELFASPACDSSGYGEGALFLGWMSVATDPNGHRDFVFDAPFDVPLGQAITATTTDPAGSTSELAACVVVPEPPPSIAGIVAITALVAIRLARRDGCIGHESPESCLPGN